MWSGSAFAAMGLGLVVATTVAATDKPKKPAQPQPAPSAERNGAPASYRASALGKGYSLQSRRMADCLATYPSYDPATDRIRVSPGVTLRCEL